MRGSSLAWPASLDALRPFIVTFWSGRTVADMPDDVRRVIDDAGYRQKHINIGLFALDADGKLLRSSTPYVRPPAFRFDPEAQGRDFRRQLDTMLDGLSLPKVAIADPPKLALPDVADGVRIYLTFGKNKLNHYRTPTVEAAAWTSAMREALRYPEQSRAIPSDALRPILEQLYPPAVMDGHGGCRTSQSTLTIAPDAATRSAVVTGQVVVELDDANRTRYEGPLSLIVGYDANDLSPKTLRGVGRWEVPKRNPQGEIVERIVMTAAIESRPK